MSTRTKNILGLILVIFVLYWIVTYPQAAADFVHAAFNKISVGVRHIFDFFSALINTN
jgi:hypothetical protein